tara:strand:- start:339 stop:449 length:111 start_codon:yes stop_codon:yes gene_type:complete
MIGQVSRDATLARAGGSGSAAMLFQLHQTPFDLDKY